MVYCSDPMPIFSSTSEADIKDGSMRAAPARRLSNPKLIDPTLTFASIVHMGLFKTS